MTDIAEQNLQICKRRWPTLAAQISAAAPPQEVAWEGSEESPTLSVNGLRLWSAYDAEAEARLQATMIPEDSKQAWVYGVGSGDLARELLKRDAIRQLNLVPLNLGLFHLLMHVLDYRDWLSDSRTQLWDPGSQLTVNTPFSAIPPCLQLCDPPLAALRDHLTNELIRPFEEERQARRAPMRRQHIEANMDFIASDGDVAELFGTAPGSTAFVCAAGPTLLKTAPWIIEHRDEGLLIAVDGALKPLLRVGLIPDYVLSLDDNSETIARYFDGDLSACTNSTLIYTPIVDHAPLSNWPGRKLTMYTHEPIYDDLKQSHPKAELFVAGSVIHPAVDLAVRLRSAKVLLFGADFGFPDGVVHANDEAPIDFYANAAKAEIVALNGHGQSIPTLASFNGYRIGLEDFISHHQDVKFINMCRAGAFIHGAEYEESGGV
ncbi:MAG: 6-hydroxymethylpterin diphosphokinase MptE-like protein [Sedimenticolaceae bacterium]